MQEISPSSFFFSSFLKYNSVHKHLNFHKYLQSNYVLVKYSAFERDFAV